MLRRFSINFAIFSMVMDVLWTGLGLALANSLRPLLDRFTFIQPIPNNIEIPLSLYIIFPVIWITILASFAIYDGRKYLKVVDEFTTLTLACIVASISMAGILYFSYRQVSRALFMLFVVIVYTLFLGWRILARIFFRIRKDWPDITRKILIVGAGPLGVRVYEQLRRSDIANITCIGFVDDNDAPLIQSDLAVLGTIKDIRTLISDEDVTDIVIALPYSVYQRMGEVVSLTANLPVKVWVALGFFDLALYKTDIVDFGGIPMVDLRAAALSEYQLLIKRGFDIIFGNIAIILMSPLMGLIAIIIWLDVGRPILFFQKRVGANGRLFDMYKFRTMEKNADELSDQVESIDKSGNLIYKTKHDPRVTHSGRILRRFSLDELPQLLNVIQGTMSLVGPRPELIHLVEKYQPWQRKRFSVPPGITGWWQINGRSDKPMHLHTEDDLYYIQNYSLFLDIQILTKTIWIVLIGKGSY